MPSGVVFFFRSACGSPVVAWRRYFQLTARDLLTILEEMARLRVIIAAILSCSLPQTSLSRVSSSLGAIVYAEYAHLGAGSASAGATVFPCDKLHTEPDGSLQIRVGAARPLLSGSSSTILTQENERPAGILTTGSPFSPPRIPRPLPSMSLRQ